MLMKANNETRELGELYTGEMVRKIIAGEKTQTRRPLKLRDGEVFCGVESGRVITSDLYDVRQRPIPRRVGDRIYARETIRLKSRWHDGARDICESVYAADDTPTVADAWPWKRDVLPSIHCPMGLARVWYEITDVRVQRVQEISEEDARAEGCSGHDPEPRDEGGTIYAWHGRSSAPCPRAHFMCVWDALYGKTDGLSWHQSPWVWAYTFRVLSTTGRTA